MGEVVEGRESGDKGPTENHRGGGKENVKVKI